MKRAAPGRCSGTTDSPAPTEAAYLSLRDPDRSLRLMIGPTGVGKTFLVKLIASKIGVPFVKGDATK